MKTLVAALLVLLVLPLAITAQVVPSQVEVNKLVDRWLSGVPDTFERDELILSLHRVNRAALQKPLKTAIGDAGKRAAALELAVLLRVGGLFDSAKKFVDGDLEELVTRLALAALDKGAAAWALDRWKQSGIASASWKFADQAFLAYPVPFDIFRQFRDYMTAKDSDEHKREPAAMILAFQLGVEMPEKPADLLAQWDKLKSAYDADARNFAVTGFDLLRWPSMGVSGNARRVGTNVRMNANAQLTYEIPPYWHNQNFTLNLQVRWISGDGLKLSLMTDQLGQYIKLEKGDWLCPSFKDGKPYDYPIKAKTGEWTKVSIKIVYDGAKSERKSKAFVGDKEFHYGELPLNGNFTYFTLFSGESSVVVGAVELIAGK